MYYIGIVWSKTFISLATKEFGASEHSTENYYGFESRLFRWVSSPAKIILTLIVSDKKHHFWRVFTHWYFRHNYPLVCYPLVTTCFNDSYFTFTYIIIYTIYKLYKLILNLNYQRWVLRRLKASGDRSLWLNQTVHFQYVHKNSENSADDSFPTYKSLNCCWSEFLINSIVPKLLKKTLEYPKITKKYLSESDSARRLIPDGSNAWKWTVLSQTDQSKRLKMGGPRNRTALKYENGLS